MSEPFGANGPATHTSLKLGGVDLLFGMSRSEWVTLFKETIDVDRLCSSLESVLEQFPNLKGRLVRRGAQLFVERMDAGALVEVIESENPAPAFGAEIYPILANGLVPEFAPASIEDQADRPVSAFRIIRYSDGRVTVGMSTCHALVDAGSVLLLLTAWHNAYCGEPAIRPLLDRTTVLKLAGEKVERPSAKSGLLLKPFDPALFASPPPVSDFFGMFLSEAEHKQLVEQVKQRFAGSLSFNNYLQAMVLKVFAQSSPGEGQATTHANMSYDLRRMGPGVVPVTYFGGATIFRSFPATFDELRHEELSAIAQRFRTLGRLEADEISQDVGYLQTQYEAGNINTYGAFSEFLTPLVNTGLYINNMLGLGRPAFNFGNNVIWGEMPLRMPFAIRKALFIPNRAGGVSIRMALPIGQRELFLEKWNECIAQELRG